MAVTHLLLAQKTHERGQNLERETERGERESKEPARSKPASIKLQALSPRMGSKKTIAK